MTTQTAVLGGGCFWCTEAVFQEIKGVTSAVPGYAGGKQAEPSYQQVSMGTTGHAEVVKVEFDPEVVSYMQLLRVFFATHDPTTRDRQGNDIGSQYRSVILFNNDAQKKFAEETIAELNQEYFGGKIVTEVQLLGDFYEAEEYHHNYFKKNPTAGYCQVIISPKVAKLRKEFAPLLAK